MHSYYHLVPLVYCYCFVGYLSNSVDYSRSSYLEWFTNVGTFHVFHRLMRKHFALLVDVVSGLNPSVKLHALHGSVVPTGVTVPLGLCNPPRRGHGELAKPGFLYPLVWIPCCDTINYLPGSRSRVGNKAGDLESWVTFCDR
jgi:hypothetical protein